MICLVGSCLAPDRRPPARLPAPPEPHAIVSTPAIRITDIFAARAAARNAPQPPGKRRHFATKI
jgi:hypothetical protein